MSYQPQMYRTPFKYDTTICLLKNMAHKWIKEIFQKNIEDIKIKGKVLDVGCGTGKVTQEVLSEMLEEDAVLEACDISQELIDYASKQYKDIRFFQQDAASPFPKELLESYDFILSNIALHWVKNLRAAFTNFYHLLKPNGKIAVCMIGHHPLYDILRQMAKDPKWSSYMGDVENFIPLLHDEENTEDAMRNIMTECGFLGAKVNILDKNSTFDNNTTYRIVKGNMEAVDPIVTRIPDDKKQDYLKESFRRMLKVNGLGDPRPEDKAPSFLGGHVIAIYGEK